MDWKWYIPLNVRMNHVLTPLLQLIFHRLSLQGLYSKCRQWMEKLGQNLRQIKWQPSGIRLEQLYKPVIVIQRLYLPCSKRRCFFSDSTVFDPLENIFKEHFLHHAGQRKKIKYLKNLTLSAFELQSADKSKLDPLPCLHDTRWDCPLPHLPEHSPVSHL